MPKVDDQTFLREQQYKNASNLNARVLVHARFSTNKQGWQPWLFEQLRLPARCGILELGCGPGNLWRDNWQRLPDGWLLTLTDFSAGMVEQARRNLGGNRRLSFALTDAQHVPFADAAFGAVLANHMLYHVPDRACALAEIRRVLHRRGRFYAATVGERHMAELADLVRRFDPKMANTAIGLGNAYMPFTLENGMVQVEARFAHVAVHRYDDALEVTEAQPLVDYVLSGSDIAQASVETREQLLRFVQRELSKRGAIHITKDSGVFEAW